MKSFIFSLILFVTTIVATFAEMTNGAFYVDAPVECHLVSQNGATTTNQLTAGKTYMVTDVLIELYFTNKTTVYFSGGPLIEAQPASTLAITIFDVDAKNLEAQPRKAEFGSINLGLTLNRGEFSVVYPNTDAGSAMTVSTPFAAYQLGGGKYFYRVSEKSAIVYVVEGAMQMHGDKKVDKTSKGNLAVAIPFSDPGTGIEDKILTSIKTLKQEETEKYSTPVLLAEKKWGNVGFIVISGRLVGVWLK